MFSSNDDNVIARNCRIGTCDIVSTVFRKTQVSPKILSSAIAIGLEIVEPPTKKLLYIRDVPFKVVYKLERHIKQDVDVSDQEDECEEGDDEKQNDTTLQFTAARYLQYINNSFKFNVKRFPQSYDPLVCELSDAYSKELNRNKKAEDAVMAISHCTVDYATNYIILEVYNYHVLQFLVRRDNFVIELERVKYAVSLVLEFDERLHKFNTSETDIKFIADIKDKVTNRKAVANCMVSSIFNIDRKGLYTIKYKQNPNAEPTVHNINMEYLKYKKYTAVEFGRWHANGRLIPQVLKSWIVKDVDTDDNGNSIDQNGNTNENKNNKSETNQMMTGSKYLADQRNVSNLANSDNTYCRIPEALVYCRNLLTKFLDAVEEKMNESGIDSKYLPAKMDIFDTNELLARIDVETIHLNFENIVITKNLKNKLNASEFNASKKSASGDKTYKKKAINAKIGSVRVLIHSGKIADGRIKQLTEESKKNTMEIKELLANPLTRSDKSTQERIKQLQAENKRKDEKIKELTEALNNLDKNKSLLEEYLRELAEIEAESNSVNKPKLDRHYTFSEAIELQSKIDTYQAYLENRKRARENGDDEDSEEDEGPRKKFKLDDYNKQIEKELEETKAHLEEVQSGANKVLNKRITDFFVKKTK